MSAQVPPTKPRASLEVVMQAARKQWAADGRKDPFPETFLLMVRAYRRDTMGKVGVNDLNMYDDAVFCVSPQGFKAWNCNTDPTRYGWNPHADGYMARLKPGCYWYEQVIHRGKYAAFGQADNAVTIDRVRENGSIAETETGEFGINLHMGGDETTSSEGCMTVPKQDYRAFHTYWKGVINKLKLTRFRLILVDGPIV